MKLEREELIRALESVEPGLSPAETVEQSSCFCFVTGRVYAFNMRLFCHAGSGLPDDMTGAIPAKSTLHAIKHMPDEYLNVSVEEGCFVLKGSGRKAGIRSSPVVIPIDKVERPETWTKLDESFSDAVSLVQGCAGKDPNKFVTTCVSVTPKWIEAFDNRQAARFKVDTGLTESCLVERDSIKHVVAAGISEVALTQSWIHFRSPEGVHISCRRFVEQFPALGSVYDVKGDKLILPKSLPEVVELAERFATEDRDSPKITVEVKKNKIRFTAEGVTGYAISWRDVQYSGAERKFSLPPDVLKGLAEKGGSCVVSDQRIVVNGGRWRYAVALGVV